MLFIIKVVETLYFLLNTVLCCVYVIIANKSVDVTENRNANMIIIMGRYSIFGDKV